MTNYIVNYTNSDKTGITIPEGEIDSTTVDISLFGRIRLEYGQELNENLLHILEHFAAYQTSESASYYPASPDTTLTTNNLLSNPINGQLWYNKTQNRLFVWNIDEWRPLGLVGDYAANWGQITGGNYLPKPVSSATGHIFDYDECIWSVAPANITGQVDFLRCYTDANALVTMQQRFVGTNLFHNGIANYLIIGIRGNINLGELDVSVPEPTVTPTPTPTRTATPITSAGITPTPTVTITPTSTPAASGSPSTLAGALSGMNDISYNEITCLQTSATTTSTYKSPVSYVQAVASGGTPPYTYTWNIISNTCGGFVTTSSLDNYFYVDYIGDGDDIGAGCDITVSADIDDSGIQSITTTNHIIHVGTSVETIDCCVGCEPNTTPDGSPTIINESDVINGLQFTMYLYPPRETCTSDNGWWFGSGSEFSYNYYVDVFTSPPGLPPGVSYVSGPASIDAYPTVSITIDEDAYGCSISTSTASWTPLEVTFEVTDSVALLAYINSVVGVIEPGMGYSATYKSGGGAVKYVTASNAVIFNREP